MFKILLVEDNEMNRDMLSRRLQRTGYQVLLAMDGQSGLESALAETPDLILMDMSLPVLDGWEASRKLKADPQTGSVPIIALTAHVMAGDRERASRPAVTIMTPSRLSFLACCRRSRRCFRRRPCPDRRGARLSAEAKSARWCPGGGEVVLVGQGRSLSVPILRNEREIL